MPFFCSGTSLSYDGPRTTRLGGLADLNAFSFDTGLVGVEVKDFVKELLVLLSNHRALKDLKNCLFFVFCCLCGEKNLDKFKE